MEIEKQENTFLELWYFTNLIIAGKFFYPETIMRMQLVLFNTTKTGLNFYIKAEHAVLWAVAISFQHFGDRYLKFRNSSILPNTTMKVLKRFPHFCTYVCINTFVVYFNMFEHNLQIFFVYDIEITFWSKARESLMPFLIRNWTPGTLFISDVIDF